MIQNLVIPFGCFCVFWLVFSQCHRVFRWFESLTNKLCGELLQRCGEVELPVKEFQLAIQCVLVIVPGIVIYIAFVKNQFPFAVVAALLGIVGPRILLKMAIERQEKAIRQQMVTASNFLVAVCGSGSPITDGFRQAIDELPSPVNKLFGRIVSDHQNGRVLVEAIDGIKKKLSLECFTLFSTAIQVSLTQGGNLIESLDRISHSLEENDRLEGKMLSDTAESRRANVLMACMPVIWFGIYYWHDYETLSKPMFNDTVGQIMTALVFLFAFFGYRYAENILRLDV